MINQLQLAQATKIICLYYQQIRPVVNGFFKDNNQNNVNIFTLIDKEIIGVLQQKLLKILFIEIQNSNEDHEQTVN
jgi:hypothetical protein